MGVKNTEVVSNGSFVVEVQESEFAADMRTEVSKLTEAIAEVEAEKAEFTSLGKAIGEKSTPTLLKNYKSCDLRIDNRKKKLKKITTMQANGLSGQYQYGSQKAASDRTKADEAELKAEKSEIKLITNFPEEFKAWKPSNAQKKALRAAIGIDLPVGCQNGGIVKGTKKGTFKLTDSELTFVFSACENKAGKKMLKVALVTKADGSVA